MAHVDGNPQRSDVAHPIYGIVPVSFDLSVRFRTALVPTPTSTVLDGRCWQQTVVSRGCCGRRLRPDGPQPHLRS
ncbi:hypothetical protein F7R04_15685 [Agrobacterium radiobacter]|nr:hypothetical protein F7R04_15685 [Agrobacterium tumefaciens]